MKLFKLIEILEFFYPKDLAENWDNVGLLIGDERAAVKRVMTTLEITPEVIEEAVERNADTIISHHPIIFKPLNNLNYKNPQSRMIAKLIKSNINVYAMHTNVDISSNGMNDWLSQVLDMKNISILKPLKQKSYKKLVIDVTASEVGRLIQILNQAGAGQKASILEQYDMKKKEKYIKNLDEQESLQEVIEISSFILEENLSDIRRLLGKDFYYEVFEIDNINQSFGLGRVGTIRPASLEQVAEKIKSLFSLDHVRLVGDREAIIKKIAVVGGSGSDLIIDAKLKGCDAIITGDVGFHDAQLALAANINILDPGHNIEIIFNDVMSDFINLFDEVTCFASEVDTNPFEVI